VDFSHWNAHSIFFTDPAGNLVEYIARHALTNAAEGAFTVNDILYASEIAFIVNDVQASGKEMMQALNITEYQAGSGGFWPIGDEHGLLLIIRKGREWSAPPGEKNVTDIFKTGAHIYTGTAKQFQFTGFPYTITATTA
jgi:hypothetical protein